MMIILFIYQFLLPHFYIMLKSLSLGVDGDQQRKGGKGGQGGGGGGRVME